MASHETDDDRSMRALEWGEGEPSSLPGPIENRWALLVGVNRFNDPTIPHLNFCVNDALALAETLHSLGYTVVVLRDDAAEPHLIPTTDNVEAELSRLCQVAGPNDLLWVHFACHGKRVDKQPVLVLQNTRLPTLAKSGLPLSHVEELMRGSKTHRLVLTLDACHVGVEIGRDLTDPQFIHNVHELAEGFALIAGSTAQQKAQDWREKKHGVFTYYLLEGLSGRADRGGKDFVTVDDLSKHVLHNLRQWSVQNGGLIQEPTIRTEGLGDMILADHRNSPAEPVPNPFSDAGLTTEPGHLFDRKSSVIRRRRMSTITWLHLSDLHFRAEKEEVAHKDSVYAWDRDIVLKSLLADVRERIEQDGLQPNFIVVSGDIAFSGADKEYKLAAAFFDDLLKTTDLDKSRLFVVPGNHDVDRSAVSFGAEAIASSLVNRDAVNGILTSEADRQLLLRRLDGYVRFVTEYFDDLLPLDDRDCSYVRSLDLAGRRIAILGLNSAWVANGGDADYGKLLLGERQVRVSVDAAKMADLRLAVMHHPFNWLKDFDGDACEPLLMGGCDFILHGHLHRTGVQSLSTPDAGAMVVAAGASYETREHHNAYNFVQLDAESRQGTVYLRMYSDQRGGFWTKDVLSYKNVADGEFAFALPSKKGKPSLHQEAVEEQRPAPPAIDPALLEARYLRRMQEMCNDLPLTMIDPKMDAKVQQNPMRLLPVYVSLNTRTMVAEEGAEAEGKGRKGRASQDVDIEAMLRRGEREARALTALEAIEKEPRMVLLGDPGSGKSTFVKHLALCLADGRLERLGAPNEGLITRLSQAWTRGALLPIYVTLREFAGSARCNGSAGGLWQYIEDTLAAQEQGDFTAHLREQVVAGNAIVLLDGLDEVADPETRKTVRQSVAEFVKVNGGSNRYLVTCRSYSYQETCDQLKGFAVHTLAPFTEKQVNAFIDCWHREVCRLGWKSEGDAKELAQRLQAAARRSDLAVLASNPLQLTMMTLLHYSRGQLPEDRVKLYKEMVELLLVRWDQARLVDNADAPTQAVNVDDLETALERVAYLAHRQQEGLDAPADIEEALLRTVLKDYLQGSWDQAGKLLAYIKNRAGLLIEKGPGVYVFPHRSYQEYLAGAYLTQQEDFPDEAARLAKENYAQWREVILWAVGVVARLNKQTYSAINVADALCPRQTPDRAAPDAAWRSAHLAGEALLETGLDKVQVHERYGEVLRRARERLVALLRTGALSPRERAAAGDTLARLGDPRFRADAWFLPDEPLLGFVEIPAGPFLMGTKKEDIPALMKRLGGDQDMYERETPPHTLTLPGYYIARYPVTVAQFRAFVEASGREPVDADSLRDPDNRPVRWVTWREAVAYCEWLTGVLRDWKNTPEPLATLICKEGWAVRLPSEAEWEKAARGVDGRQFPWGDDPDPARANCEDTGIGTTSTVGCFPGGASPYGCEDMSGNVWEWTRSLWGKDWEKPDFRYPYVPGDERERLEAGNDVLRVVRGVSFNNDAGLVRCAYRGWLFLDFLNDYLGFRVAVLPMTLDSGPSGL